MPPTRVISTCLSKSSYPALPLRYINIPFLIFFTKSSLASLLGTNCLIVILSVKSVILTVIIYFPVLVSLSSIDITCPLTSTRPVSSYISAISLKNFSSSLKSLPNNKSVSFSSSSVAFFFLGLDFFLSSSFSFLASSACFCLSITA